MKRLILRDVFCRAEKPDKPVHIEENSSLEGRPPDLHLASFPAQSRQGLATNWLKVRARACEWGGLSQPQPHLPRRAVSPVAGDRLHSRANLPCTVSRVDL